MAVNRDALESALERFFDPEQDLPTMSANTDEAIDAHQDACAQKWADAMQEYVADMEPDHVAAISGAASASLKSALKSAFSGWYASGVWSCSQLNAAFDAFAAQIFASPALTFPDTAQIPRVWAGQTLPPGINFCVTNPQFTTYSEAAKYFADLIHAWFIQGVSVTVDDNITEGKLPHTATWDGVAALGS